MERRLSDPMPDNFEHREELEEALRQMAAGEKAEQDRIARELKAGEMVSEKLYELDGPDEAARIIGKDAVEDLQEVADKEDPNEWARRRETKVWLDIMAMKDEGKSSQEIIDEYGEEELEGLLGPVALKGFKDEAQSELEKKGDN